MEKENCKMSQESRGIFKWRINGKPVLVIVFPETSLDGQLRNKMPNKFPRRRNKEEN